MRGVQHGILRARVLPVHFRDHVGRAVRAHDARDMRLQTDRQLDGLEAGLAGGVDLFVQVEPGGSHQPARRIELDPARGFQRSERVALEVTFFDRLRVLHHRPRIAREVGAVDDQHARRAQTRGLFVLVGPASVVGQGLALEELLIVRGRLVHNHEQHFAFHVHALVVVPAIFRRIDAVAHEHDWSIDVGGRLAALVLDDEVGVVGERHGCPGFRHKSKFGRGFVGVHGIQVDFLKVGAVVARGLQPVQGELGRDVLRRQLRAALAGAAAFQQVACEKAHMGADVLGIDQRGGIARRGRNARHLWDGGNLCLGGNRQNNEQGGAEKRGNAEQMRTPWASCNTRRVTTSTRSASRPYSEIGSALCPWGARGSSPAVLLGADRSCAVGAATVLT